jgi:hypothetical protein
MNEHISRVVNHPMTPPVAVGIVVGAAAFAAGFLLGKRHSPVEVITVAIPTGPSEEKKIDPNVMTLFDELGNPLVKTEAETEIIFEELSEDEVTSYFSGFTGIQGPTGPPTEEDVVEAINRNVFANSGTDDGWDLDEQLAYRATIDVDEPYPIHRDEFLSNESGYQQTECVYYAGDDIMTDDTNTPIYNYQRVMGSDLKFGFGSGDPKVVYIRNDERGYEYEILKHEGTYAQVVLGLEIEENIRVKDIKHSNRPRKMRDEE